MSSSKSSQSTAQTDNRRVIGENGISAEGSSVNVWNESLDADVINRALSSVDTVTGNAFDFGSDTLGFAENAVKQVLTYGANATNQAYDNVTATTDLVKDAYADAKGRGALTDQILIGAIAAMALVAFMAVKK